MIADFYARDPDICSKQTANVDMLVMAFVETIVESRYDLDLREKVMVAIHTMVTSQQLGKEMFQALELYNVFGALQKFKEDVMRLDSEGTDNPENPFLDTEYVEDLINMADG